MKYSYHAALGSNTGDRKANLERALELLRQEPGLVITRLSSMIVTPPWGKTDQPDFLNMAIEVESGMTPRELLDLFLRTERAMGRERLERWGPRVIDIDLLLAGGLILDEPGLKIPHPLMHEREFVLEPLTEIAPGAIHPVFGDSIQSLLQKLRAGQDKIRN
ncbi:MAG: Bifunctional folate synthesis protein [Myxococcota bacterium]|nr:Bifunctional folate synthesis protein [Myxococcota bacterium]